MRARIDILQDLVQCEGDLNAIDKELRQFPWDMDDPLIIMDNGHFLNVLQKAVSGEISMTHLEDWAKIIECREDLGFGHDDLWEMITELANPVLFGGCSKERLLELMKQISA